MKTAVFFLQMCFLMSACKEGDTYVTNITAPDDWQPPELRWSTPPDAELRGTVGLDVTINDSSAIAKALLFVDGIESDSLFTSPWRFEVVTDSLDDGVHVVEARAWDEHGNMGVSPVLGINVMNSTTQGPQLIWVPDNFARIQDAINAATDFDTIRVRDGMYIETLNLFGKGLWIESEHGPMSCTIDGDSAHNTIFLNASQAESTIRGFNIIGASFVGLELEDGAQCDLFNCILQSTNCESQVHVARVGGNLWNNLLVGGDECITIWALLGSIKNNILMGAGDAALWDSNFGRNPVEHSYNLYWQNSTDYYEFSPGIGDIHEDPQIDLNLGRLRVDSPAIDSGDPQILDNDSTRSDIGPFGGPWAY